MIIGSKISIPRSLVYEQAELIMTHSWAHARSICAKIDSSE